jgi:Tfp pilus assembly protein PilO
VNKKPAWIAALAGFVAVLLMIVGLILPKASAVRNKQKEVAAAQAQMQTLQTQLQELQADKADAPKDRKKLQKLETQIPPTADLPGLIRTLNATADQTGLDWMAVSPGQPVPAGSLTVIPVQLTRVGGFFAVDQYLHVLETMPRINAVSTLQISAGPSGLPQLQVALTANFFTTDPSVGPGSAPDASGSSELPGPVPSASPSSIGG